MIPRLSRNHRTAAPVIATEPFNTKQNTYVKQRLKHFRFHHNYVNFMHGFLESQSLFVFPTILRAFKFNFRK